MRKELRGWSWGEFLERSLVLADMGRNRVNKKKAKRPCLRLCRSEENLLKQEEILILGDKVGGNWVGKLDWLGERYGTGIKIWRGEKEWERPGAIRLDNCCQHLSGKLVVLRHSSLAYGMLTACSCQ